MSAKMDADMTETGSTPAVDVLVVGATIAGLTAARDLAMRGYRVLVIDEAVSIGGAAAGDAAPFLDEEGDIAKLAAELDLELETPRQLQSRVIVADKAHELPKYSFMGIPATPLANDVIAVVGWGGALRAYLDRLTPVLKIGRYDNLAHLVRKRMGHRVAERMLRPVVRGTLGIDAAELAVDDAVPGLNNAITRAGSLSGGVAILMEEAANDDAKSERLIEGGLSRLVDALADAVTDYHGEIRIGSRIDIAEHDDQGWLLTMTDGTQLRAQTLLYAETDMQQVDRVVVTISKQHSAEVPSVHRVFAATGTTATGVLRASDTDDGDSKLVLEYPADERMADSEYVQRAGDDLETLLGVRLELAGTEVVRAPRFRTQPTASDAPTATVHVVAARQPGVRGLSETVRDAREIAQAVHREDFAVPGVSWAQEVNDEFEEES